MKRARYLRLILILAFFATVFCGCVESKRYGKLRLEWRSDPGMTIKQLQENWENYDIHYSGYSTGFAAAIMFDPRDDDRKLTGVEWGWFSIKDQETLTKTITYMSVDAHYRPKLWRILDPDDRLYGYVYTKWEHAVIRVVDEKTLLVEPLTHDPVQDEPGQD